MDALTLDLTWRRNAPDAASYTLTDENGAAVNLTGYAMRLQVRQYQGAIGDPIVDLNMAAAGQPGIYFDNAAAGQFTVTPPTAAQLQALPTTPIGALPAGVVSDLAYDLLLIHPDGAPEAFMVGSLTLVSGVTRLG